MKDIFGHIWPRNWGQGGDLQLCSRCNLAILLYNASLSKVDAFEAVLKAVLYCQDTA